MFFIFCLTRWYKMICSWLNIQKSDLKLVSHTSTCLSFLDRWNYECSYLLNDLLHRWSQWWIDALEMAELWTVRSVDKGYVHHWMGMFKGNILACFFLSSLSILTDTNWKVNLHHTFSSTKNWNLWRTAEQILSPLTFFGGEGVGNFITMSKWQLTK